MCSIPPQLTVHHVLWCAPPLSTSHSTESITFVGAVTVILYSLFVHLSCLNLNLERCSSFVHTALPTMYIENYWPTEVDCFAHLAWVVAQQTPQQVHCTEQHCEWFQFGDFSMPSPRRFVVDEHTCGTPYCGLLRYIPRWDCNLFCIRHEKNGLLHYSSHLITSLYASRRHTLAGCFTSFQSFLPPRIDDDDATKVFIITSASCSGWCT